MGVFFSQSTLPDLCDLMHMLQPINCINWKHTLTLLLASFMFQQPSKKNTGGTCFVRSHAVKGARCTQPGEARGVVPTLPLGHMKLCLSVAKAEVTARGRGGGTWELELRFIGCMRLGECDHSGAHGYRRRLQTDGCSQTACSHHSSCLL